MQFKWQLQPKFLLLVCAVLPLTIAAGFWQLDRAEQKSSMLAEQNSARAMPAQELDSVRSSELKNYIKVHVDGEWSEAILLLDNRIRSGRVGYEVISILEREDSLPILVNRGWVAAGEDRTTLPEIAPMFGRHRVEGYLYRASQEALVLAEQQWSNSWPERLQALDFGLIENRIGRELYPYVLRINFESPFSYQADWTIEEDGPDMHIGYALQWFLMSLTVVLMTIFASSNLGDWLKSKKKTSNN